MGGGGHKVCVCGGAGGIGQPLCLLMAMEPDISELAIFDLNVAMVPPSGVAADLGHLESKVRVTGHGLDAGIAPKDNPEGLFVRLQLGLSGSGHA